MKINTQKQCFLFVIFLSFASVTLAQNTAFEHRGFATDGTTPLNGNYDVRLVLYTDETGPTQVGNPIDFPDFAFVNGFFTAYLTFGTMPFTTQAQLYLGVMYKPVGSGLPYVWAANREPLRTSPFALRAHHATTAGYAVTADSVGGIYPASIVQNNTSGTPQQGVTVNVGGDVSGFNINSQNAYHIGFDRVLDAPFDNLYVGRNAGARSSPQYLGNSFFGTDAGRNNATGLRNSFFGSGSGQNNLAGDNSFFGYFSGASNRSGTSNSFFGSAAGASHDLGSDNVYVGRNAALNSTSGSFNTLIGSQTAPKTSEGSNNTFVGYNTGRTNIKDSNNTLLGASSDADRGVQNSTAVGSRSRVDVSNAVILGSVAGINGAGVTARVGIGTTTPANALEVINPGNKGLRVQTNQAGGTVGSFGVNGTFQIDAPGVLGGRVHVAEAGNVGVGTNTPISKLHVNGAIRTNGDVIVPYPFGIILQDSGGHCYRLNVNQSGQVVVSGMFCP